MESAQAWARECFGNVDLGDQRLNRRAVVLAQRLTERSGSSVNGATSNWSEAKGGYRLLSNAKVTYDKLLKPHASRVRSQCGEPGEYLLIEDTTSLDFTDHEALDDIGWIGDGRNRGIMVHSTLGARVRAWDKNRPQLDLLGLFGQIVWVRTQPPGKIRREKRRDRYARPRESQRWARVVAEQPHGAPDGCRWTFVADRESDIYEVAHERLEGMDYIIRSNQNRRLSDEDADIRAAAAQGPLLCTTHLALRARPGRSARTAKLQVRARQVQLRSPARPGQPLGASSHTTWVVDVSEPSPPQGVQPLHWLLLTSWECTTAEQALKVAGAYASRWLIEEYHKALKTGMRIEAAQLKTRQRIENLLAFLAVGAVRLLKAKLEPDGPIEDGAFDPDLIALLTHLSKLPPNGWTNRTLLRAIAQHGGFNARKGDGEPGWMSIWRGFQHLNDMAIGYKVAMQRCG